MMAPSLIARMANRSNSSPLRRLAFAIALQRQETDRTFWLPFKKGSMRKAAKASPIPKRSLAIFSISGDLISDGLTLAGNMRGQAVTSSPRELLRRHDRCPHSACLLHPPDLRLLPRLQLLHEAH